MRTLLVCALAASSLTSFLSAQVIEATVNAARTGEAVNPLLFGINTARWDESLFPGPTDEMLLTADRDAIGKIAASGVTLLKYPGGNDADSYIWNSPDNSPSEMDTDEYIALCRAVGSEPFITVNFNAPAELAAEWVRYCNVVKSYGVTLWEVGDEQWGTWARGHAPPEVYAKKYIEFVDAMRAVDPKIKVATNVPLGPHPENWTTRVLQAAGDYVDILTFTYFPQKWGEEHDDTLLASVRTFRELYLGLRREMEDVLGKDRAERILTVNVGYNSVNHSPGPQTLELVNAVWTADMIGTMAEVGVDIGCYWALHNSFPPRKGDYGYLSSEGSNTPSYSYFVFPMLVASLRGAMVESISSDAAVSIYAATSGPRLGIALVNRTKVARRTRIRLERFAPGNKVQARILDADRKNAPFDGVQLDEATVYADLPPYGLVTMEIPDRSTPPTPRNIARDATAEASSRSMIGPHFGPESAIDGLTYTKWNSAAWTKSKGEEAQWFRLSWFDSKTLRTVIIRWGASRAVDYVLETSSDGLVWRTVGSRKGGSGEVDTWDLGAVSARFIRMSGTLGTAGISAYSIREFEVY